MSLLNKLENIDCSFNEERVPKYCQGSAENISDFWTNFVEPRLPQREVVEAWHKLLKEYVEDTKNITCAIRYGNGRQTLKSGEIGDNSLRRGWLTKNTEDDFQYFYADNFLLAFFDKLYLDANSVDDVPSLQEFKEVFDNLTFPYAYNYFYTSDKNREFKYHKLPVGKNPGFTKNGYKICHIIGTGTNYKVKDKVYDEIKQLSEEYFDLGCTSEWADADDNIRKRKIEDDAKKVIIAVFLRFIHPMNNFLSPSAGRQKHETLYVKDKRGKNKFFNKDIGEYPGVCEYAQVYMEKTYGKLYEEFLSMIMLPNELVLDEFKDEKIGLQYDFNWNNADDLGAKFEDFKRWLLEDVNHKISENTYKSYRSALKCILAEEGMKFDELCECITDKVKEYTGPEADERKKCLAQKNSGTGSAVLRKINKYMKSQSNTRS